MSSGGLTDTELERLASLAFLLDAVRNAAPVSTDILAAAPELIAEVQRQRKELARLRSERDRLSLVVVAAEEWQDDPSTEADTALHRALYAHEDACKAAAARVPARAPWDEPDDEIGLFDPPYELTCPRCSGRMTARTLGTGTKVLLECEGTCRRAWQAPLAGAVAAEPTP